MTISLLASVWSLSRARSAARELENLQKNQLPVGRVLVSLQSDASILSREWDRRLSVFSQSQSSTPMKVRPLPGWIEESIRARLGIIRGLATQTPQFQQKLVKLAEDYNTLVWRLQEWMTSAAAENDSRAQVWVRSQTVAQLFESWQGDIRTLSDEVDRSIRRQLEHTEIAVHYFQMSLQALLAVMFVFSLLLLWVNERALRPLAGLTRIAHEITQRGLKREDRGKVLDLTLPRKDEVSELAREFHQMATTLLEREQMIESQRKRLEDQNEKLKRLASVERLAAVGRLSAQVAHEIRNPLHSIGLEAELGLEALTREKSHPIESRNTIRASLSSVLESVDRLQGITENYLRLSKPSKALREEVNLEERVQRVLAENAAKIARARVKVDWKFETAQPILGDASLIENVLGNLIRNSLQALEGVPNPCIQIALENCVLRVGDNGPGVDSSISKQLFEPFVTTKASGTGLGLSFCKKALDEMGASIQWVNPGWMSGACFEIRFLPAHKNLYEGVGEDIAVADRRRGVEHESQNFVS